MALLDWINMHDCGVTPTAVQREDGTIEVRVLCINGENGDFCEIETVRNYGEARDALGC